MVREGTIVAARRAWRSSKVVISRRSEVVELSPPPGTQPIARGVPASTGVAVGAAVFDTSGWRSKRQGKPVVLVREQTETADIEALAEAEALVTAHGARTSHAAVVARQLGKVCLVGCHLLRIDAGGRSGSFGAIAIQEGEPITVDGTSGVVFRGEVPVKRVKPQKSSSRRSCAGGSRTLDSNVSGPLSNDPKRRLRAGSRLLPSISH